MSVTKIQRILTKPLFHYRFEGEVVGFIAIGLGAFLSLTLASFDVAQVARGEGHLAGPVGAWLSEFLLGSIGVASFLFPVVLLALGSSIVWGFAYRMSLKHVCAIAVVVVYASVAAELFLPVLGFIPAFFGYGGVVGFKIKELCAGSVGYGGSVLLVHVCLIVALRVLGIVSIANFKGRIQTVRSIVQGLLSRFVGFLRAKDASEAEIIKDAIKEELRNSESFRKLIDEGQSIALRSIASKMKKKASAGSGSGSSLGKLEQPLGEAVEELADESVGLGDEDITINFDYTGPSHSKPTAAMFTKSSPAKNREKEFEKLGLKLTAQLLQFNVEGKVKKIVEGPVVTTFEFEPVPGTKLSKITGLSQDLARMLQAKSLRILAPIPGKKVVGFEVPNADRRMIGFADLVADRKLKSSKIALPVAMGMDAFGKVVIEDMAKMPHLLVAGSTGSGKSVFMNTLIGGLIARHSAKDLRFVMIDPKMVELAAYNDLPHLATPVITDPAGKAKGVLDALVAEMENRFTRMSEVGARNLEGFNELIKKSKKASFPRYKGKWQTMPFIVLIVDELADMMMVLGKDAEMPITRLAQKARAAGIHLVIATQRPSADVVTGLIKANFPTRIGFRVLSGLDSRTILDAGGAEGLIGQGDMLFLNSAGLTRMHGAFLSDDEVHKMVKACRKK